MRAITYDRFGPANDVLDMEQLPIPKPATGEVLVRLHTSGVNPSDVRARSGGRPGVVKPPFPKIIPHSDGAGIIESVGEGASSDRIGERVWIWNGQWQRAFGTAAEYVAMPQEQAVQLPANTSFEIGAILGIPALTAVSTLQRAGDLDGKLVLVSGGSGTVGRLAIQVAKSMGACVYTTAGSDSGIDSAKSAGADAAFNYNSSDLTEQILTESNGRLFDLIVEVEFGKNIETGSNLIKERGKIVTYGSAKSMVPEIPFYPLLFKGVSIDWLLVYTLSKAERSQAISYLTDLLIRDALDFQIAETMDLADCANAHEIIESGNRTGSVLLTI